MPFIVPMLPAIITAASTAVMGGLQLAGVGQPHQPSADELARAQSDATAKATADAQNQQRLAAVQAGRQYMPNIQAAAGGAVSPDYYAQTAATQTGFGDQTAAIRQALGMVGLSPSVSPSSLTSGYNLPSMNINTPLGGSQSGQAGIPDISTLLSQMQGGGGFHGGS